MRFGMGKLLDAFSEQRDYIGYHKGYDDNGDSIYSTELKLEHGSNAKLYQINV